jgi:hypothetical protein
MPITPAVAPTCAMPVMPAVVSHQLHRRWGNKFRAGRPWLVEGERPAPRWPQWSSGRRALQLSCTSEPPSGYRLAGCCARAVYTTSTSIHVVCPAGLRLRVGGMSEAFGPASLLAPLGHQFGMAYFDCAGFEIFGNVIVIAPPGGALRAHRAGIFGRPIAWRAVPSRDNKRRGA